METSQSSTGEGAFAVGLLVGGLIGAALGLWYAPDKGVDTRQMLLEQTTNLLDRAERMILGERSTDALAEGRAIAQQRQIELSLDE